MTHTRINMEFKSDLPPEPGFRKLDWTAVDSFEEELKGVLRALENVTRGRCDHIDYVRAYRMFVERWAPRN